MSDLLLGGFHILGRKDRFRSSLARLSPPRSERSLQKFSCKAFTSSIGKIFSNLLWQGFHLLDRADRFQTFSCKVFTSSTGKIASEVLLQGFHLLDRESDESCNSLWRYAFWLKTPYTGYGTLVETPDFRQYNKNRRIEAWIGRFGSVFVHELSLFHGC